MVSHELASERGVERTTVVATTYVPRDLDSSGNLREQTRQGDVLGGGEHIDNRAVLTERLDDTSNM